MTLSKSTTCYIFGCNLLGAKLFKKYWVVGGSFWNTHHTNKNSSRSINRIIQDSFEYTKHHLGALFIESLVLFMSFFTGYIEYSKIIGYIPIMLMIHGYPLMIHQYNRILANEQLDYIKKNELDIDIDIEK